VNPTALAWKLVPKIPAPLARWLFDLVADAVWLVRGKGVRQLEANLRRVVSDSSRTSLRRLSRQSMRRYLRYYCEAFQLPTWSGGRIDQMVRLDGADAADRAFGQARQAVGALAHMGNWDLAGAWACRHLEPVITVAERLKPEEAFQEFLAMRQALGLRIIPLEKGKPAFPELLAAVRSTDRWLAPLLAERDLGRSGVEVTFFGEPALVAAGPAALALAVERPLAPIAMWRDGPGYVLHFGEVIAVPEASSRAERIQIMTQAWVSVLEEQIRLHPADWHMLQKVFVADLDPAKRQRLAGA
jgi:KDO2-lipid IV(A) lauroyltransferase